MDYQNNAMEGRPISYSDDLIDQGSEKENVCT